MLEDNDIDFIKAVGFGKWPGNSPELNVDQNLGSIAMEHSDKELDKEPLDKRFKTETIKKCLKRVLRRVKQNEQEMLEALVM